MLRATIASIVTAGIVAVPSVERAGALPPPMQIMPIGDSITYGWSPTTTPGGYRGFLHAVLTQAEVRHQLMGASTANSSVTLSAAKQIRHDGHNGYRIDQIATNLDGVAGGSDDRGGYWLTGTYYRAPIHPHVVLLHIGSNDILKRFDPSNSYDDTEPLDEAEERARFIESTTGRLQALVDKILQLRPNATILLSTVAPVDDGSLAEQAVVEYSASIRAMVAEHPERGDQLRLVEVHGAFFTNGILTPGLLSQDGIHPTPSGYSVIGQLFAEAVQALA